MEIRVVLRIRAIRSLFSPYMLIKNAPILPNMKNKISPINGEKIIGKRTGRLVTCFTVAKGLNVRPKSVLVQM
jgi:hypothetical protein